MSSDQAGCSSDLNWIELPVVESGLNHFLISLNPSHDPCKLCGTILRLKRKQLWDAHWWNLFLSQDAGPAAPPLGLTPGYRNQNAKQEITKEQLPFWRLTILANNQPSGMELLQTQTTLLAILKTRPSSVWTSTATSQLFGMTARLREIAEDVFDTVLHRRRCAGTGQRANVSPGARRSASRWTWAICWEKSSTFWAGGLWRVQPGGVHRVHHRGDNPGSEGRPGGLKS